MSTTTEICATLIVRFGIVLSVFFACIPPLHCQNVRPESALNFSVHVHKATARFEAFGLNASMGEGAIRGIRIPADVIGVDGSLSQNVHLIARVRGGSQNDTSGFVARIEEGQRIIPFATVGHADGSVLPIQPAEIRRAIKKCGVLELMWTQNTAAISEQSILEFEVRRY